MIPELDNHCPRICESSKYGFIERFPYLYRWLIFALLPFSSHYFFLRRFSQHSLSALLSRNLAANERHH